MPGIETRTTLPSNAIAVLEKGHISPGGTSGVVAHWGEKWEDYDLRKNISESYGIDEKKLAQNTGFDAIYRQPDGISREDAIADELAVAKLVVDAVLEANNWKPEDVYALMLGSGVPVIDDPEIHDYAQEVARMTGMRADVKTHNTHAACSSGAHALIRALDDPTFQGEKVLALAMEGIAGLTADPKRSDHFSTQVFSNGAAGLGIVPGQDIVLLDTPHHKVKPDDRDGGALAAVMKYEHLLDPNNPSIWQETPDASLIRVPKPEGDKLIRMRGMETTIFFVKNGLELVKEVYNSHISKYPKSEIAHIIAHHASRGVNEILSRRLNYDGLNIKIPWVVNDGNSSAATTLIAMIRLLEERAQVGTRAMMISYGAGASFDGAVFEYGQREG